MSGSLSAVQMGALPGLKYATVGLSDDEHGVQTGSAYQNWMGGETGASLRTGNFSTASRNTSYATPKGKIPLSHSSQTIGSYLFAAEEARTDPAIPAAAGTKFQKEG